jgi:hypothetical protein
MSSVRHAGMFMIGWDKPLILSLATTLGITRDEAKQITSRPTPNEGNGTSLNGGKDWNATTRQARVDPETKGETNILKYMTEGRKHATRGIDQMNDHDKISRR